MIGLNRWISVKLYLLKYSIKKFINGVSVCCIVLIGSKKCSKLNIIISLFYRVRLVSCNGKWIVNISGVSIILSIVYIVF